MKRNILAVVIPALLVAGAANAAEVYNKDGNKLDLTGKVTAKHYFSDDSSNNGDKTYARLGFKGETQITSELTGYGRFEYEFSARNAEADGGKSDKTRYAFAGLKFADYGSFDYGRNMGIAYDSLAWTDVLPEWGGDQSNSDNFLTGRSTGVATYRNKNFFGLVDGWNFAVQYQGKNSKDTLNNRSNDNDSDIDTQNGDGWGISSSYESDIGLGIVGSYSAVNRTDEQNAFASGRGKKAEAWGTGLKYDANSIYLAATYNEFRNVSNLNNPGSKNFVATDTVFADKTKVFEAVAQYNFDFGLTPSLGYVQAKAQDDANNRNDYITKYVSLGATYAFNKNMSVYTEYDINLIKSDNAYGLKDDDKVAVGLTYQF
ncbi:porin [Pectobacterium sp. FL60-S17]|uniref:Porin n=2 Tax=Pectobacteriaceae TaxID=1903410 RepID=A0AAE2WDV3_9GAMM|nr:porin [Pectobacterium quasiaquaticum]MBE5209107.1 porin [Pectobacterium quasiaquaticum]MBE5223445.1 porin [Pectobacterium quasiaquaticum]MBN3051599.1 porin [Pectobacterium brasiliense]